MKNGEAFGVQALRAFFMTNRRAPLMPTKPRKPCRHSGCPQLTAETFCELHARIHAKDRPCANDRGYDHRWQKARKQFLARHPLCAECERSRKLTSATVVDHIQPHRGDQALFWDEGNWQPLCKKCHDRKTRLEDQHPNYGY